MSQKVSLKMATQSIGQFYFARLRLLDQLVDLESGLREPLRVTFFFKL